MIFISVAKPVTYMNKVKLTPIDQRRRRRCKGKKMEPVVKTAAARMLWKKMRTGNVGDR